MFKNLIDIIASPRNTFQSIREKPSVLFPFLLIIGVVAVTQLWVMYSIDFDYFIESMVEQTAAQRDVPESQIREGMENMSPGLMGGIGAVSSVVFLSLVFVIYAAYLNLMAKLSDDQYNFKTFFSLICWTSIPTLFNSLAAILNTLFSSTGQFSQQQLNPLSFNSLLFQTDGRYATLLSSLSPTSICV